MADDTDNEKPQDAEVEAQAADEAQAEQAAPEAAATPVATKPAEPAEHLSSKERRRRERSTHTGEARATRTPEERHAERVAERRKKAVSRRARRLQERAKAVERRAAGGRDSVKEPLPPVHAPVEGARKVRQGVVVSDKADKTITVRIDVARRHRRYEKIVRSSGTLHAHDENNEAHEGDVVRVIESRPLSRTKRWKLVDVLEKAR
jgi:small subunit ribosomal protein S17